jgi:hypothetical protein
MDDDGTVFCTVGRFLEKTKVSCLARLEKHQEMLTTSKGITIITRKRIQSSPS